MVFLRRDEFWKDKYNQFDNWWGHIARRYWSKYNPFMQNKKLSKEINLYIERKGPHFEYLDLPNKRSDDQEIKRACRNTRFRNQICWYISSGADAESKFVFLSSFINVNYIKIVIKLKMQKDFKMLAFWS